MEATDAHELQEQCEQASADRSLHPVSFTISVLAVLVAIVTVLGHRSHTEAVLSQARASDQWNLYQARKIRQYNTELTTDLLSVIPVRDPAATKKTLDAYRNHLQKWNQDLADSERIAGQEEQDVHRFERRADRFDLGEALLEIGLVIASITLLTRQRSYWYMGMIFGLAGLLAASLGLLH